MYSRYQRKYKPRVPRKNEDNKMVVLLCGTCERYFDLGYRCPIVLPCNHTVCEDCIRSSLSKSSIKCKECHEKIEFSDLLKQSRNIRDHFATNFYLLGQIYCYRPYQQPPREISEISFQPAGSQLKLSNVSFNKKANNMPHGKQFMYEYQTRVDNNALNKCTLTACSKEATLRCNDCREIYCDICAETLHKSARGLMSHQITSLNVHNCHKHSNSVEEFNCNDCKLTVCVYCYLSDHKEHNVSQITKLVDEKVDEFKQRRAKCEEVLYKLQDAYKSLYLVNK